MCFLGPKAIQTYIRFLHSCTDFSIATIFTFDLHEDRQKERVQLVPGEGPRGVLRAQLLLQVPRLDRPDRFVDHRYGGPVVQGVLPRALPSPPVPDRDVPAVDPHGPHPGVEGRRHDGGCPLPLGYLMRGFYGLTKRKDPDEKIQI
jgi:hypothetical protein